MIRPDPTAYSDPRDKQLVWSLGSLNPSIAAFPHRIVENSFENLTEWCKVVGVKGATWQLQPIFELSGEYFTREIYSPDMLHFWETSENQAHLPVMMNADLEFPMIVSARTAPSVLQKIWDHPVRDYYSYLEHLAVWIESLEWAYVPLEYENGFALVVAGKSQRGWITEFDRLLTLRHETVFELSRLNDRFHLTGPVQWG